jgi:hypothetical protein
MVGWILIGITTLVALKKMEYPKKIWPDIWYVYVPPCIGS